MKVNNQQLKQIIKEEIQKELLKEAVNPAAVIAQIERLLGTLKASLAPKKAVASQKDKTCPSGTMRTEPGGPCYDLGEAPAKTATARTARQRRFMLDKRDDINEQRANPVALITNIITQLTRLKASLAPKKAAAQKKAVAQKKKKPFQPTFDDDWVQEKRDED